MYTTLKNKRAAQQQEDAAKQEKQEKRSNRRANRRANRQNSQKQSPASQASQHSQDSQPSQTSQTKQHDPGHSKASQKASQANQKYVDYRLQELKNAIKTEARKHPVLYLLGVSALSMAAATMLGAGKVALTAAAGCLAYRWLYSNMYMYRGKQQAQRYAQHHAQNYQAKNYAAQND